MKVLDLGCGDGTTAFPPRRLGADVLGVDIAANLVAAGNARAKAAGLDNLRFQEGDASNLAGIADDSFDLVVSIFGAMFAPRPFDVAREMVRVTKPGGRIVMGNWIPGDPTLVAQILKISAAYTPPPPEGFVSPMTWGDEDQVRERFEAAGIAPANISFERATWHFRGDGPPTELLEIFRRLLRADDERLRGRREGRPRARAGAGAERPVRRPEPGGEPDRNPRDLPQGHRDERLRHATPTDRIAHEPRSHRTYEPALCSALALPARGAGPRLRPTAVDARRIRRAATRFAETCAAIGGTTDASRPHAGRRHGQLRFARTDEICKRLRSRGWSFVGTGEWQGERVLGVPSPATAAPTGRRTTGRRADRGRPRAGDGRNPTLVTRPASALPSPPRRRKKKGPGASSPRGLFHLHQAEGLRRSRPPHRRSACDAGCSPPPIAERSCADRRRC